ncbi:hypothetical protein [Mesorhizobium sp. M7A.F.Ca.US.010.02.1.1]|uniref:hypothetical protein n=1 Tax=Mesorhizobium sp. M7A.F.Ca.US.010.02.1.1 TaxID=2496743 RepID=UPI000FD555C1|nr:hypothetical protein [Mesorhizobium sp. M7A.F.Ca.US.010.02.1.1]RUW92050.1 hypothetical protein EOA19_11765 [Mesorhizobium sp. M7A.F.Ca.US.010.02.1.1]
MFAAILAEATAEIVLADLAPADQAALVGVPATSLLAFAGRCSPTLRQRAALLVRDRCLVALAEDGFSAAEIARDMERYAGNGWKRDLTLDACPDRYSGRPQGWLWLAFKAYPEPLSRRRIAEVIENIESMWRP